MKILCILVGSPEIMNIVCVCVCVILIVGTGDGGTEEVTDGQRWCLKPEGVGLASQDPCGRRREAASGSFP